jgi:Holliday junction resolvase
MTEKCWKRAERRIAELLGGRRIPVSGRQRGDCPDVEHPTLSIECKSRKSLPNWIEDALVQAEASSRGGQVPVVVLHQHGQRYRDALAVMRLEDLRQEMTSYDNDKETTREDSVSNAHRAHGN